MIKVTMHQGRGLAMVNPKKIVYIVPNKIGSEIVTTNGTLGVVETPEELYKVWHDFCTNSNISTNSISSISNYITTNTTNSTNSEILDDSVGGRVENNRTLHLLGRDIPVDGSVKNSLWDAFTRNPDCYRLLEYWMEAYEAKTGGQYVLVSSPDMGTIAACVRNGDIDKAQTVIDWLFEGKHYRALWLLDKGMVNPAVVISSAKIDSNYQMANMATVGTIPALPKTQTKPINNKPMFDEHGNLI